MHSWFLIYHLAFFPFALSFAVNRTSSTVPCFICRSTGSSIHSTFSTTFLAGFFFLISMALKSIPPATVTYRLKVCSCIPCSFSISTLYSPSSSCFTFWNPRMICPGPLVQLLHLGSVARSLEHLNHVIVGIGSPTMSRKKKALSPSVAETLSAGFTYFGSFPLAARGVEVLSH